MNKQRKYDAMAWKRFPHYLSFVRGRESARHEWIARIKDQGIFSVLKRIHVEDRGCIYIYINIYTYIYIYPIDYIHGFIVLCFVVFLHQNLTWLCVIFARTANTILRIYISFFIWITILTFVAIMVFSILLSTSGMWWAQPMRDDVAK